jgi:hypothetical protein
MLQRLYIHNFRCLQNFEFKPGDASSALLIGKNGSGKSTLVQALKIFQAIGRGSNRVGQLLKASDFAWGRTDTPLRLELQTVLDGHVFAYTLALDLPERFNIDWHLVALPVMQDTSSTTPLGTFREWLARMVLLAPMPRLMHSETVGDTLDVTALRRGFHHSGGQIWMTSHNEEAVRRFSHDNTWVLGRKSHLEPTLVRSLAELGPETDLIQALICGELEP